MKKTTTLLLATMFAGTLYANECLDALDKYNEFSDLSKDAKSKQEKLKHEKTSMKFLKQVAHFCDHLKAEEKASINKALNEYNNK